ncbi:MULTISPECIES: hypothetical protein [Actinosynnema]|uniref:hypothetical protein n=1 Tax=Actinosynnema TaxID=40566 RepID=UPI0020A3539B|nr:hypothetical protein [Actinosynnema pretiosum]MCP2097872.1 hypothetical protein [Actinosynnema pretiosum]
MKQLLGAFCHSFWRDCGPDLAKLIYEREPFFVFNPPLPIPGVAGAAAVPLKRLVSLIPRSTLPNNRALHEQLLETLRTEMGKPSVKGPKLKGLFDDLWRPGAKVGNGSTVAAARFEVRGGPMVKGGDHITKAKNYADALQKWIKKQDKPPAGTDPASAHDYRAAQNVLQDLLNALEGK